MNIAVDYDGTWSASPNFWAAFVRLAEAHGHRVRVVTARSEIHDRTEPLQAVERIVPVIYTRGIAKRFFLEHFVPDFPVSVWVDDRPESIIANSTFTPEQLVTWRAEREH